MRNNAKPDNNDALLEEMQTANQELMRKESQYLAEIQKQELKSQAMEQMVNQLTQQI
jgi:hypothetical protein